MKQKAKNLLVLVKQTLFDDTLDRYLFLTGILLLLIDFLIWHARLASLTYIFLQINVYPIKYLSIVVILNTLLSIAAHDSEKEVGYLLLMGSVIVGLLCLTLEIFYLTHLL